jgi:hypothetical protein
MTWGGDLPPQLKVHITDVHANRKSVE